MTAGIRYATLSLLLLAAPAGAQTAPPVLSTVPVSPPGTAIIPAQMSGQPLTVGDLPPGIVVVRVVRQSFAENVTGQTVRLNDVASGVTREATTDVNGRAQFAGFGVGATVQAATSVDGETLLSQAFQLPPHSGVRLVLVAGVGAGAPPPAAAATVAVGSTEPVRADPATMLGVALGGSGILLAFVWLRRRDHDG